MPAPPAKRGRPPLRPGEASIAVTVTLAVKDFDRLCAIARARDASVAAVIRDAVSLKLRRGDDSTR